MQKELKRFVAVTLILFYAAAFLTASPAAMWKGMGSIITARDALITDYFALAGYGSAFLNAALVLTMGYVMLIREKTPFTGLTLAALFISAGFALFGKNPVNILPIIIGTWIYAKFHHSRMGRYIYTALFGTCLAPFVTELVYLLPFTPWINGSIAVAVGIMIGFLMPPLSVHAASMHMGYNLFNVGFSAGIIAFVLVCVLESFGLTSQTTLVWQEGRPLALAAGLYLYFLGTLLYGLWLNKGKLTGMKEILRHPGRAVADFVLMSSVGATLINMGLLGMIGETYILIIGGDLSGPVVGSLLTAFGFAAFGAHPGNYWSPLLGVYLVTLFTQHTATAPGIQLAALFAVGIAPIAGQFGPIAGIIAGMLHVTIVTSTVHMYGGLNLYNNGFSCGFVAIFMIPLLESMMKGFKVRADHKKQRSGEKGQET